jgi:hypothetical protein
VSASAERLLAVSEERAVGRQVTELLLPADVEAVGASALAEAIIGAAGADDAHPTVFVRPGMTFGLRLRARIVACGPPRAALICIPVAPAAIASARRAPSATGSCGPAGSAISVRGVTGERRRGGRGSSRGRVTCSAAAVVAIVSAGARAPLHVLGDREHLAARHHGFTRQVDSHCG